MTKVKKPSSSFFDFKLCRLLSFPKPAQLHFMKYTDKLGLINTISGVAIATFPFILTLVFKWDEIAKTRTEQTLFILSMVFICLLTTVVTLEGKKLAKIAGFAYGYFYNFIYEIADLINDDDANVNINNKLVKTAKADQVNGQSYATEYSKNEVKILLILPGDIHAEYRFSELMASIFDRATVSPAKNAYYSMREKSMKAMEINKNGKKLLVLIDTPPTTIRAIKLYRESCFDIDHNDSYDMLDNKHKAIFHKICKFCKKNVMPIFRKELNDIIYKLTKASKRHEYKEMIKIISLEEVIAGIIDPGEFSKLTFIGDNLSAASTGEKQRVLNLIQARKNNILDQVATLMTQ